MKEINEPNPQMTEQMANETIINSAWTKPLAIAMIVLGLIAIWFPFAATITSTLVIGWVFLFAGVAQMVYAFHSKGAGHLVWQLILGLLYFVSGIFVIANPLEGAIALTLVLGISILIQGIIQVSMAIRMRRTYPSWGWMLLSGLFGIVVGIYVWGSVPEATPWLIGTLLGVNLIFDGVWMWSLPNSSKAALNEPKE